MAIGLKSLQKIAPAKQALIAAALSAAMLGLFWYFYISPLNDDVAQRTKDYELLLVQNAKTAEQLKTFAALKRESEALQAELDHLKMDLPLEKETHEILEDIQKMVSGSSLKILKVGPRATIDHEFYTEWPWDFEVVGSYHNIGAFLDRVRNLPRIVSVGNLRISSRASSGPEALLTSVGATYTATTYVYREDLPAADAAAAPAPK